MGTRGVINVVDIACAPGSVFSVLTATVASVYESCVSRVTASTFESQGYYYDCF